MIYVFTWRGYSLACGEQIAARTTGYAATAAFANLLTLDRTLSCERMSNPPLGGRRLRVSSGLGGVRVAADTAFVFGFRVTQEADKRSKPQ